MTGISDFGYDLGNSRRPVVRHPDGHYSDANGRVLVDSRIEPVEVVGPGQVAVDAADLRDVLSGPSWGTGAYRTARARLNAVTRAALAAAEPAPDGACGRYLHISNGGAGCGCGKVPPEAPAAEPDRVTLPDTPWTTVRVTLEGGRQWVWRTEGEGEPTWRNHGNLRVDKEDLNNVVDFTILAQPPKAYDEAYEQGWDDGWTFAKKADPAAEPDRVTLPDPTPPIVWSFADEEPWRPEHITFNGAKYILAQPPTRGCDRYE